MKNIQESKSNKKEYRFIVNMQFFKEQFIENQQFLS